MSRTPFWLWSNNVLQWFSVNWPLVNALTMDWERCYQDNVMETVCGIRTSPRSWRKNLAYPCILKSQDGCRFALIHVDDILVVGKRDFVMIKFLSCLQSKYEVSKELMEKRGDEVSFLKRKMVLQHDSRITIQAHHSRVDQICSLLGLNKRLQNKRTPGHAEMDQLDTSGEVSPDQARVFRTCVGILLYLASDLPHCQHVVRRLSTYSTQPTTCSMTILRHLVSYLACHEDICVSLLWRGRNSGLFHQYGSAAEYAIEIFTDSDWASNKETRRSISCSTIFFGNCLLYSSSRTQKLVSLSSAEAEVYACSSGASDGLLLSGIISWMTNSRVKIYLLTDSSGPRGILQRQGVGRVRHLSCRVLWLQEYINSGQIKLSTVAGSWDETSPLCPSSKPHVFVWYV